MKAISRFLPAVLILALFAAVAVPPAHAQNFTTLYPFKSFPDGAFPEAALVRDSQGNLYGTTPFGGDPKCRRGEGCGVVFKVDAAGRETLLHTFYLGADGGYPKGGLIRDSQGNLYGAGAGSGTFKEGTVFKFSPSGHETVLYSFCSQNACVDGSRPEASLIRDDRGNLYGTTVAGGVGDAGVVFKLDTAGKETVLHSFCSEQDCSDGGDPMAGLVRDAQGNLYGTTSEGGAGKQGVVFKLDAAGHESVLHAFTSGEDGAYPVAGLIFDAQGNLYGTTQNGGGTGCDGEGCGVVFKIAAASGKETILYTFTGGADGGAPSAGLLLDAQGNLYGTTYMGGLVNCAVPNFGCGTVFKLDTTDNLTVLHSFTGEADGGGPLAALIGDGKGSIYGTTLYGGDAMCKFDFGGPGCGVVYKISP